MTDDELRARWRAALEVLEDASAAGADEPDPGQLWDALHGELSTAEALRVTSRALAAAQGHEELRLLIELDRELAPPVAAVVERRSWRGWAIGGAVALAAAILIALVLRPNAPPDPSEGVDLRAPSTVAFVSEVDGAALPRKNFELTWAAPGEECTYTLRASTARGDLISRGRGSTEPRWTLEPDALAAVPDGGQVLWQVDFDCSDVTGRSQTLITRIAPAP